MSRHPNADTCHVLVMASSVTTAWHVVTGLVMNILGGIIYTYIKHLERAGARRRQSLETGPPQSHDLGTKRARYKHLLY